MQRHKPILVGQDISAKKYNKKSFLRTKWLAPGLIVLLVIGVCLLAFNNRTKHIGSIPNKEVSIITTIGQHYLLPEDEEPAIASVTDKTKLNSTLARRAENGDRILIYQKNRQAIVYRPSIDKIVDITPVQIDVPQSSSEN